MQRESGPLSMAPPRLIAHVLLLLLSSLGTCQTGKAGRRSADHAAALLQSCAALQSTDPQAALEHAAAAAAMLGKGRPKVPAGKPPSAKALLWAKAQVEQGAATRTMVRFDEAAVFYARALSVLEAAPRGTRDATGRPLEMEILAVKMERGWALSKGLRHAEALAETAALRAYAPPGEADAAHFETTLLLQEARLLWCNGQDSAAIAALETGLDIDKLLDPSHPPGSDPQETAVKMNDLLQLYRWASRESEAETVARQ